jgi:proline dehydrogenase
MSAIARYLAKNQIAGTELRDGMKFLRLAAGSDWNLTLAAWHAPEEDPHTVVRTYLSMVMAVRDHRRVCRVAVKPEALQYDFAPMRDIIDVAKQEGVGIQIDSNTPDSAAKHLAMFVRCFCKYHNVGYTLPARWGRSLSDAVVVRELGAPVRIVKGQWNDTESSDESVHNAYLALVEAFVGGDSSVGIATHDARLAGDALNRLNSTGTECELEQMLGLPWIDEAVLPSVDRRLYIPVGYPYLPYNFRFGTEHPDIFLWMLKDGFMSRKKKMRSVERHLRRTTEKQLKN